MDMQSRFEEIRWSWLRERLEREPAWIERRGGVVVVALVVMALGMLTVSPFWSIALLALGLVVTGIVELSDFAVRSHSALDPRGATLLLLTGAGALGVLAVRVIWG
jgi:hypothetical protein